MLPITAVLGSYEFGLHIWRGAKAGSQISTSREDCTGGSTVLPMLSGGLQIELSDLEAEIVMLQCNYLWQVFEIVIQGVPTVLVVCFMCLFMTLSRILLHGSVLTNVFDPMRHRGDPQKVQVGIRHLGNVYLAADIIPPGIHFVLLLGLRPSFGICFLVYLPVLHEFHWQDIGFGHRLIAGSPG